MIDISNFTRQHKDILSDINEIDKIVNRQDYEEYLNEFVSHINNLSGRLKIHLSYEDKFLYPSLVDGQDTELKNLAQEYAHEMGDIADVFSHYKNEFNTKSKIIERLDTFKVNTKHILDEIKNRISKEENGLYKVILEKRL
ncbi:hemerythrin domain-containing protein [Clostridium neuense]|uniref:Hemerythrin domain-containing protein n=1 Tax=Clostridium neuense TaxID=1728934 RepID=A0ABW8TJ13_9CLOT